MPDKQQPHETGDELMTIAEICTEHGVSRQTVHAIRARPGSPFPEPVIQPGSTRPRYPRAAVAAYFAEHPLRPGRRTDLQDPEA